MVGSLISLAVLFACFAVAETQGGCYYQGNIYEHGDIFTPSGGSGCLRYICNNSYVRVYEYKCHLNGTCYPVGNSVVINCHTYTCTMESRAIGGFTLRMRRTESRCNDNGTCHAVGVSYNKNCNTYVCTTYSSDGFDYYRINKTLFRCKTVNGRCVNNGVSFNFHCVTYKCITVTTDAGDYYHFNRTRTRCEDHYGVCHVSNTSGLTKRLGGELYTNCTCETFNVNATVSFSCNPNQVPF